MRQTATVAKPPKPDLARLGRVTVDYGEEMVAVLNEARERESRDTLSNLLRTWARKYLALEHPDLAAKLERLLAGARGGGA